MSQSELKESGKIAQKAFLIISAVGITEIIIASLATSVALLADGIHSIASALIFLIVWIGLRLSGRSPDGTFHFGYYRIESLGSLIAAFILSVFGGFVIFEAYRAWISQRIIVHPEAAIVSASIAAGVVALVSWRIEKASGKSRSTALRAGGLTGVVDVLSSVAVVIGVYLSAYLEVFHADAIAGFLISLAIFAGAYSIFRESSLVLVDACQCGDVVEAIGEMARDVKGIKEVHSIRLRHLGRYLTGDLHIVVENEMLVKEADKLATQIEERIKEEFEEVLGVKVRIESDEAHTRHSSEFTIDEDSSTTSH